MKVICFSSRTAVWYFALPEAVLAFEFQKRGHEVLYITPGKEFPTKSSRLNEKILRKSFSLKGYGLDYVLQKQDREKIKLLMGKLTKKNFENLVIDGIEIGKIALYEFLLRKKKLNTNMTDEEWKEATVEIGETLISFFACKRIIEKEKPDFLLMYGELYCVNRVWDKLATLSNVGVYFMQNWINFSDIDNVLVIGKTNSIDFFHRLVKIWVKVNMLSASPMNLHYVTENFIELVKAKHFLVYSSPKSIKKINIRKFFDIGSAQKILVATMSSYDELFAAQYVGAWKKPKNLIFSSQAEWIKNTIEFLKTRPDLSLIIRIHPREFPNKRDSVKSEHAKILQKVLQNLPNNVKVNWPTDNISIYDLAQETAVFLNAWSSVGVEMSLLGIPVVLYAKDLALYPPDLNYIAKNHQDYFAKINQALKDGWSYKRIKMTFRWLVLYYCHPIIRFRKKRPASKKTVVASGSVHFKNYLYGLLPLWTKPFIAEVMTIAPGSWVGKKQKSDCESQLKENVDISGVEKMFLESGDTLVDINKIKKSSMGSKAENKSIRNEVEKMYKVMYGKSLRSEVKKGSLQYNLRKIFLSK